MSGSARPALDRKFANPPNPVGPGSWHVSGPHHPSSRPTRSGRKTARAVSDGATLRSAVALRNSSLIQAPSSVYVPRMPSRRSQPQGAPTELSEATRLKFAELLMALAALCTRLLAGVTEALLQSDTLTGAQRTALRVAMAGLGPIARQVEAQAAQFRDGLPEPDDRRLTAAAGPRPWASRPRAARPAAAPRCTPPPGPAPPPAAASRAPAGPRPHPRPRASPADPSAKISPDGLPLGTPTLLRYRN